VLYVILTGERRRWREFRLPSSVLLFFLIAAPWHILAGIRNPNFFWFYFVNEHFLRFLGKRYPVDYKKVPPLPYWILHLVWLFPWSLYLPLALRNLRRDFKQLRGSGTTNSSIHTRMICWIWGELFLRSSLSRLARSTTRFQRIFL
jgi:4-amino-4-deoxy-L-arabinose transferase-like glycosyltransferase